MFTLIEREPGRWQVLDAEGNPQEISCTVHDKAGTPIPLLIRSWATREEAQAAREARLEWIYYSAIKAWLKSLRVCTTCATLMSFAKVERWAGRSYDWKAARGECTGVACLTCPDCTGGIALSCPHPINCEDIAAQHASKQPAPPCEHPANPKKPNERKTHGPASRAASPTAPAAPAA